MKVLISSWFLLCWFSSLWWQRGVRQVFKEKVMTGQTEEDAAQTWALRPLHWMLLGMFWASTHWEVASRQQRRPLPFLLHVRYYIIQLICWIHGVLYSDLYLHQYIAAFISPDSFYKQMTGPKNRAVASPSCSKNSLKKRPRFVSNPSPKYFSTENTFS